MEQRLRYLNYHYSCFVVIIRNGRLRCAKIPSKNKLNIQNGKPQYKTRSGNVILRGSAYEILFSRMSFSFPYSRLPHSRIQSGYYYPE